MKLQDLQGKNDRALQSHSCETSLWQAFITAPPPPTPPTPTTLSFPPVRPGDGGPGETLGLASVSPPLTSQPSPHTPSGFRCARDCARCWGNKRNNMALSQGCDQTAATEAAVGAGAQRRWQR